MGVSTVKLNGTTLMTVNDTTATASDVASGEYFYAADGVKTLGTSSGGGGQAEGFLEAMLSGSADLQNYTEIPVDITRIAEGVFYYDDNNYISFTSLPPNLTYIGAEAFCNCRNLALTSIPDSVTYIGEDAFLNCCNHFNISSLPSGLTRIEGGTFKWCDAIEELTIPSGVTYIGAEAFALCRGMTAYHFKSTTPPTLASTDAFTSIPANCKIYVPSGCLSAYQSASNWSTYASHMEEE